MIFFRVTIFVGILILTGNIVNGQTVRESYNKYPLFSNSVDVERHKDIKRNIETVSYSIKATKINCTDILYFYDKALEKKKFTSYDDDGIGQGKWRNSSKAYSEYNPESFPLKLLKSWVDPNQTLRLYLKITAEKGQNESQKCKVTLIESPFYSLVNLEQFLDNLTKKEKRTLMLLLSRYTDANGVVNTEKAIVENPNSDILRQFVDLSNY